MSQRLSCKYAESLGLTPSRTLSSVLMSIMTIVMSIGSIAAPLSAAARATGAASIFFTIIDASQPKTTGDKAPDVSSQDDIVLENANFAYPIRADVKVLDDLSLRFPAGKLTAIVGASGSGKSTIVGLVERWYELDGNWADNIKVGFRSYLIY
jgi:ATP-binding cassette subfamily B (MDR/TAP) protein 1